MAYSIDQKVRKTRRRSNFIFRGRKKKPERAILADIGLGKRLAAVVARRFAPGLAEGLSIQPVSLPALCRSPSPSCAYGNPH
ncbi:hypothetical protein [Bordetella avium]|uniref:hypothetical protein n=1 Tax=Bordetella avium TaxID=521 RepID=UPI0015FD3E9D|nr:hypothetical protein [Bordetella avium]